MVAVALLDGLEGMVTKYFAGIPNRGTVPAAGSAASPAGSSSILSAATIMNALRSPTTASAVEPVKPSKKRPSPAVSDAVMPLACFASAFDHVLHPPRPSAAAAAEEIAPSIAVGGGKKPTRKRGAGLPPLTADLPDGSVATAPLIESQYVCACPIPPGNHIVAFNAATADTTLHINFCIPPLLQWYHFRPEEIIGHLIGHEVREMCAVV